MSQYIETVEAEERRLKEATVAAASISTAADPAAGIVNKKDARRARAQERERRARILKPLQTELEQVEMAIAEKDEAKDAISAELENPANMSDNQKLMELTQQYQTLERESEALFTRWEELSTAIEQAEAELATDV